MIWTLRHYGPPGVFVSERVGERYAECWPSEVLRVGWGHKQAFDGYELYAYYAYLGTWGKMINTGRGSVYIAFGTLEECMDEATRVVESGKQRIRPTDADRQFTP